MIKVAPSILSCDFSNVKEELIRLEKAKVDYIHFDVMDNHFVPNLTFGHKFIKDLRKYTEIPFDIHLMITSPEDFADHFLDANGDIYTFHIEAAKDIIGLHRKIKERNKKFALSLKPNTPIQAVFPYLGIIDMVLIMTVEPGFGGQTLILNTLEKIARLKKELSTRKLNIDIEVDGGINLENIADLAKLGANVFVMGSAFFKNKDYFLFMKEVKNLLAKARA